MCEEDKAWCGECGAELELVRPGKYQCNNCDLIHSLRKQIANLELKVSSHLLGEMQCNVLQKKLERWQDRCFVMHDALTKIESLGHSTYHGRGYSLATIAAKALKEAE